MSIDREVAFREVAEIVNNVDLTDFERVYRLRDLVAVNCYDGTKHTAFLPNDDWTRLMRFILFETTGFSSPTIKPILEKLEAQLGFPPCGG